MANIVSANSLIGSLAEVDAECIGLTGISWGAHLASLAASIDNRFRFAVFVYGCGFLDKDCECIPGPDEEEIENGCLDEWFRLWDPKHHLERIRIPILWLTGTNDPYYPLLSFRKSYIAHSCCL